MRHVMTSFFGIQLPPRPPPKKKNTFCLNPFQWFDPNFILQNVHFSQPKTPQGPKTQLISNFPNLPTSKSFTEEIWSWDPSLAEAFEFCRRNCRMQLSSESFQGIFDGNFWRKKKERAGRATRVGTSGISLGEKDEFWICLPSFFWAKKKIPGLGWATLVVFFGICWKCLFKQQFKKKGSLLNNQYNGGCFFRKAHVVQFFLHHNR